MSLLKLDPESERLRRIAKAHAAGEIPQDEFRRIRSEIIEGFGGVRSPGDLDDATQRRWFRSEHAGGPLRPMTEAVVDARVRAGLLRMAGLVLIVCALAVIGAATAFALPGADGTAFDGPDLTERSLDDAPGVGIDQGPEQRWPFGVPRQGPRRPGDADAEDDTRSVELAQRR